MGDIVISLVDIKKQKAELEKLNEEYLILYEKKKDIKKQKDYFESLYMCKFGALIFLRLEKEIKYRELKKKLSLIVSQINKGEVVDYKKIQEVLEQELKKFYEELKELNETLRKSKEFYELPTLTDVEVEKIKEIFRELAKKLHPDVNININEKGMELWLRAKEAYENNDLLTLIILQGILKDKNFGIDNRMTIIDESIEVLKKKIIEIKNYIENEELQFPLNIKDSIKNLQFEKEKKQELNEEIFKYEGKIKELEYKIQKILKES